MKKLFLLTTTFVCFVSLLADDPCLIDQHQEKLKNVALQKKLADQKLQIMMASTVQSAQILSQEKKKDQLQRYDAVPLHIKNIVCAMHSQQDEQSRLSDAVDEALIVNQSGMSKMTDNRIWLHDALKTSLTKLSDKVDDLQDFLRDLGDDVQDEVYELISVIVAYRDYKLLTLGQENNEDDFTSIENFINFWGKSTEEKAARKQEKQEARQTKKEEKQALKEVKREEKAARKEEKQSGKSSSSSSSSNSSSLPSPSASSQKNAPSNSSKTSNSQATSSSNSSYQTPPPSKAPSRNTSSQNSAAQPTMQDKQQDKQGDAEKKNVVTLLTPVKEFDEVHYFATNASVVPDVLGGIPYNPADDSTKKDENDDTKVTKKPEYTPPTPEQKPKSQSLEQLNNFVDDRKQSLATMRQRALAADPVNQQRQVDARFFRGEITGDQAAALSIELAQAIKAVQAENKAKQAEKDHIKQQKSAAKAAKEEAKKQEKIDSKQAAADDQHKKDVKNARELLQAEKDKPGSQKPKKLAEAHEINNAEIAAEKAKLDAQNQVEKKVQEDTVQNQSKVTELPITPELTTVKGSSAVELISVDQIKDAVPVNDSLGVEQQGQQVDPTIHQTQPTDTLHESTGNAPDNNNLENQNNNSGNGSGNVPPQNSQPKPPAPKSWWDTLFPPNNLSDKKPVQDAPRWPTSKDDFPFKNPKNPSFMKSMNSVEVDKLLQDYNGVLQGVQNNKTGLQFTDTAYIERIKNRHKALLETKEQLKTNDLPQRDYKMNADIRGYMMANSMNYGVFDASQVATSYQHCLAQENLRLIESSVDLARRHSHQPVIKEYSHQICDLAIASQQLNQQAHIEQATAVTDINDFFAKVCMSALDAGKKISAGVAKGTHQAVEEWVQFGYALGIEPGKTVGAIANGYAQMGRALIFAAGEICDKVENLHPLPTSLSIIVGMRNTIDHIENCDKPGRTPEQIKQDHKIIYNGLENALKVIDAMAQNSLEDNAAGATKIVVNTFITGQVVSKVAQLSAATGQMLIEGANDLKNIVSPGMQNGAINYITNANGTVSVGIEGIAAAQVVADGTSLIDPATRFAQATNLFSKANNSKGGGNGPEGKGIDKGKPAVEPVKGSAEWNKLHPHGEFNNDTYHKGKTTNRGGKVKSPEPENGQAALDRSLSVDGSNQRITLEDGKIVILKYESEGVYHGYLVEDFKLIQDKNVRKALVNNGFVKDGKTGRII